MPEKKKEGKEEKKKKPDEEEDQEEETKEKKKSNDMINRANAAAFRLEEANKVQAGLLEKQESMQVEKALGGETEAGGPELTEEQKADASARKLLEGTGYEEELFPSGDKDK